MDVKDLLQDKHITFKSRGRDYIVKCLNPDHEDRNPSMRIDKISGVFNCLSCGFAGDIFKYFNINKEKFIDIKVKEVMEQISKLRLRTLSLPLDAVSFKEDFRGIRNKTLKAFGAFTTESIIKMKGRLVFPIWDIHGNIIAFQGRYLYSDLEPRYDIIPEHALLPLYPTIIKPIKNSIILVEGILDMINLHDKGLTNAVCTWGTAFANVKKSQKRKANIDKLLQYKYQGVDTIYIMYDGDNAGRHAAENLNNFIGGIFHSDIVELPDNSDPGKLSEIEIKKFREEYYG